MDCFKRAFELGLKLKGISEIEIACLNIPTPTSEQEVHKYVNLYGLEYRNGFEFNYIYQTNPGEVEKFLKRAALVGYYIKSIDSEVNSHVVFVSDIEAFLERDDVIFYIFGFENVWKNF